jgi:phosphate/sulfate permease
MRKFALVCFCLSAVIVMAARGHQKPPQSATGESSPVHIVGESNRKPEGLSEDLFKLWRSLAAQQLRSSEETQAGAAESLLRGDYIFSSTGASYSLGRTDIQSAIGGFTFDGSGNFTGFQQSRTLFTGTQTFRFGGTYTVDASGVGLLFYLYPDVQTQTIIVVKGGDTFFFVDVNSSNFREAGYARRLY